MNATPQTEGERRLKSANDSPDSVKTEPPTQLILKGSKSFAVGDAGGGTRKGRAERGILVDSTRTSPSHPDRIWPVQELSVVVLVRDEGNWYYLATPRLGIRKLWVWRTNLTAIDIAFAAVSASPGEDADASEGRGRAQAA